MASIVIIKKTTTGHFPVLFTKNQRRRSKGNNKVAFVEPRKGDIENSGKLASSPTA